MISFLTLYQIIQDCMILFILYNSAPMGQFSFLQISLVFALISGCMMTHQFGHNIHGDFAPRRLRIDAWQTNANMSVKLTKIPDELRGLRHQENIQIVVDDKKVYQDIDGFGFSLTGGSAMLINKMSATVKNSLLRELFGTGEGQISISFLRLSMGSSDLDPAVFSYNDLPEGQTDVDQTKFSLENDKANLIPVLKQILAISPKLKIIATPWSPPAWMKDNKKTKGGSLKPEYYDSYALYFVKYIKGMQREGINIYAIAPQNEPLNPQNNPSMYFTAENERDFIKNYLGPKFKAALITTKIVIYDHNLDRPDYPITIYNDPEAEKYVDGAAFHLYAGEPSVMGTIHDNYPNKNLYFTEQWTSSQGSFSGDLQWHIKNVIIGTMRNWSKSALEWNLANDPTFGPHTPGGCTQCKGALTIDGSNFTKNVAYFIIAHASQFVPPGSKRIDSNLARNLPNVAFLRPDGKKVLIILNEGDLAETFSLVYRESFSPVTIQGKTVKSIVF